MRSFLSRLALFLL